MLRKCIKENSCELFTDYLEVNVHHKSTRNKNMLLKVPKIRLEFPKQGFYFQGKVTQLLANKNQVN